MSIPQSPKPAKLIIGVLINDQSLIESVSKDLESHFGTVDIVSSWMPFEYTSYYEHEMGSPLFRRMFSYAKNIEQKQLAEIKCITNEIERTYMLRNNRKINIDPGYLLLERFVLASGKNFAHRIYLDYGIYADLTLLYQHGKFQTLPWTYPDYADKPIQQFLELVRKKYMAYDRRE